MDADGLEDRLHEPHPLAALRRVAADVGSGLGPHPPPGQRRHAVLDLTSLVQPRIETEVVFCLRDDLPATDDARTVLEHTAWVAAGFEIVQCHFEGWRFAAADCTAAFGLHGARLSWATRSCSMTQLEIASSTTSRAPTSPSGVATRT